MEMNAEGKLIVDPQKMMNDGYGDLGKMIGFIIARYIEKRWIRFQPLKKGWLSAVLCLVGLIPMVLFKSYLSPLMTQWLGSHWGKLVFSVIYAGYYIALFPLVLKLGGQAKRRKGLTERVDHSSRSARIFMDLRILAALCIYRHTYRVPLDIWPESR